MSSLSCPTGSGTRPPASVLQSEHIHANAGGSHTGTDENVRALWVPSQIDFTPTKYMSAATIRKVGSKFMYRDIVNNQYVNVPLSHNGTTSAPLLGNYAELASGRYYAVPVRSAVSGQMFYDVRLKPR